MKSVQFAIGISPVSRFSEIAKSVQLTIRIFNVQLVDFAILRNCEISSVCYQNFQCSVDIAKLRNQFSFYRDFLCSIDFAKLRNQFSLLSEFPLFS